MTLLDEKSLADPAVLEDPTPYHHALHEQPLFYDQRLGFYICSRYGLMREILRNTAVFSSVNSQTMDSLRQPPAEVVRLRARAISAVNTLVTNDPPSHTRYRTLVDDPFRPRSIEKLKAAIATIIDQTIDTFISQGHCEIVADLAVPIPIKVIADMLGLPWSASADIKRWSDASVEPLGMMISDERWIECTQELLAFQQFISAELEARKHAPKDDLLTHLVQARDPDGVGLSLPEMLSLTQQFLVAGNETTTNGIAAGVQLLIDNPEQFRKLRNQPERALTMANEVLRLEAPAQGLFRVVMKDIELAGVRLPAGARVMLRFAAANRDPDNYRNPDDLDLDRHNAGTHLAFGAGIHHCIGANLAREELTQTFAILAKRFSSLQHAPGAPPPEHHPSMILRGLKALPVVFEPSGA